MDSAVASSGWARCAAWKPPWWASPRSGSSTGFSTGCVRHPHDRPVEQGELVEQRTVHLGQGAQAELVLDTGGPRVSGRYETAHRAADEPRSLERSDPLDGLLERLDVAVDRDEGERADHESGVGQFAHADDG